MVICKKFFTLTVLSIIFTFTFFSFSIGEQTFDKLKNKQVSFLDFFLLKYEGKLIRRSQALSVQAFVTRVQYSNISIEVNFNTKKNEILTDIYAVMSKIRYSKKKYQAKLSDCNQVRNIIFYRKHGYKFFSQKRDPKLSVGIMTDIFKEVFFDNVDFTKEEIEFLMDKMFINITVFHPIDKTELVCAGKVNDYELK